VGHCDAPLPLDVTTVIKMLTPKMHQIRFRLHGDLHRAVPAGGAYVQRSPRTLIALPFRGLLLRGGRKETRSLRGGKRIASQFLKP